MNMINLLVRFQFLLLILTTNFCFGQIQSFYVQPNQTDTGYLAGQDSHLVVRNTVTNLNKLFVFIGGTGSTTQQYQSISNFAANLGYDVINLSYTNTVAAASLANSSDSFVFNKYRQEVCYGTPLSNDVDVDTLNSIYTRIVKLINFLNSTYPTQNWNQYLINPTTIDWTKISIGGHSQGGGHACYFGKFNNVDRVIMFSGPNDYSNFYSNAANWMHESGITPPERQFAYESSLDEVIDFNNQIVCLKALGLSPLYDTVNVDNLMTPFNNSHILYTTQSPGIVLLNHNVTVKNTTINNAVWEYFLTSPIVLGLQNNIKTGNIKIWPNPAKNLIFITDETFIGEVRYSIYNLSGQLLKTKTLNEESQKHVIDISDLNDGLFILKFNGKTAKIIKKH